MGTEVINATTEEEAVISINAGEKSFLDVSGKGLEKQMISPFLMAVAGAGIMIAVSVCALVALVKRMAMKRRLDKKRRQLKSRKSSIASECGGFEDQIGASSIAEIIHFATRYAVFPGMSDYWSSSMEHLQYQPTQQNLGFHLPY